MQDETSAIGKNKSTNAQLKELATVLEVDHEKNITALKGLVNKKGIAIPLEETSKAEKDSTKLAEKDGAKFNKQWCATLTATHKKAIKDFENTWEQTEDIDLRNWINETLPTLKDHKVQLELCAQSL